MINECKNCGGNLVFSPKDKGNICKSCNSVFPIKYEFNIEKKDFSEAKSLNVSNLDSSVKTIKCSSCGASSILNKNDIQSYCPYCGNSEIAEVGKSKLMNIDAIIPFAFNKKEAIQKFKTTVAKRFYANKKIFKNLTENDINGVYVNAFVFDLNASCMYNGVFTYSERYRTSNGETKYRTRHKQVSGYYTKLFDNITIESNSNLNQYELSQILPFNYQGAVKFDAEFTHGYSLEYHNSLFNDCFTLAENYVKEQIKKDLLRQYNCDSIESINLNMGYTKREYTYCLLPVYFVNKKYKDQNYKALINGQTGQIGSLPKDKLKVFLTILFSCGLVIAIVLACIFLFNG